MGLFISLELPGSSLDECEDGGTDETGMGLFAHFLYLLIGKCDRDGAREVWSGNNRSKGWLAEMVRERG
jgi:hypothetical protein